MRHRIHQLVLVFLSTILVAVPLLVAGPLASAAPAITELALPPYPAPQINGGNYQITSGPDGALWIAYGGHNSIIRMTTSGSVTEYPMPTSQGYPADIVTGPDGALWFTEDGAAKIGRITTSGTITEYAVSAVYGYPAKITVGLDGGLWFTENASPSQAPPYSYNNTIGRITTSGVVSGYYATQPIIQGQQALPLVLTVHYGLLS